MKTVVGATTASQGAHADADHLEPKTAVMRHADDDERAEEGFEATILRLDGSALEWLFRQLGE